MDRARIVASGPLADDPVRRCEHNILWGCIKMREGASPRPHTVGAREGAQEIVFEEPPRRPWWVRWFGG